MFSHSQQTLNASQPSKFFNDSRILTKAISIRNKLLNYVEDLLQHFNQVESEQGEVKLFA